MSLEEAKNELEELKSVIHISFWNREYIDKKTKAIDTVLAEIDRLKKVKVEMRKVAYEEGFKQAKFDCEMDKLNEPKEITFREGLEFLQKECKGTDCKKCKNDLKTVCIDEFELSPANWDIDNITKAVEKLKEENNDL